MKPLRVLIVDDDRDFGGGLADLLALEGYDVKLADSADAAWEALKRFPAEVSLIDLRLGKGSGIDLIASLKNRHPELLCVMMTAYADLDTAVEALRQGAYDYLRKPFHSEELLATLKRCFECINIIQEKALTDAALQTRNMELEQINLRQRLVVESMRSLSSCATLHELAPLVLEQVAKLMVADGGSIYLCQDKQLVLAHSLDPGHSPTNIPLPLKAKTVFEQVMSTGEPVLVSDVEKCRSTLPSGWPGYTNRSLLAFPIMGNDMNTIGVLSLHSKENPPFTSQDREIGLILISFSSETIRVLNALDGLEHKVSERTRDLAAANEKLKELDRLKSMFIASMSHELRTPLNSIIGFTGMLLQDMTGPINDEQRDYLSRVYSAGKHLLSLISDVIDISKIEAGKIIPYPQAFTLDAVVNEAVDTIQKQLNDKGLDLTVTIPEGVKLNTDRKRLLQCLLNYLSNAVKFSQTGFIHVKAHTIGKQVEVEISDTGIGISEEDLPKLFQPFVCLDSPVQRSVSGTGLGLYLTKKLATEILKGTVAVESQPGKGSTFLLRLPTEVI